MNLTSALIRAWPDNHLQLYRCPPFNTARHTRAVWPCSPSLQHSLASHAPRWVTSKSATNGNAFLLARHHDTSPHMWLLPSLLWYLGLNLQVGSLSAEHSISITSSKFSGKFAKLFC